MGLLGDITAYIDNLKRRGSNTLADLATNPLGLLSRNLSAFSESLPAAPDSVMPSGSGLLNRPGFQQWGMDVALNAPMGLLGTISPTKSYVDGARLLIKRPDGNIETVINKQHARNGVIPTNIYTAMIKATRDAGRGEILEQTPNVVEVSLAGQRAELAGRLQDRAGAFPGSQKWREAQKIEADLAAFDLAHPEVIDAIKTDRAKRTASGVDRALKSED